MKSNKKKDPIIVHNDRGESIRLNKYISESGFCSRREADKFIESGKVTVDGVKAVMGTKVQKGQKVKVNGKLISKVEEMIYIVLNKPVGITCTTEHKVRGNIVDFVNHEKRIFPVGRLDKDSEGLIILTNDGDIVNKILRAGNNHEKEYKKCYVKKEGPNTFRIILTQGLNRQIRRMCEVLGYNVTKLKRIRIMNINLGELKKGQWRDLTVRELKGLNNLIVDSGKTKEVDEE